MSSRSYLSRYSTYSSPLLFSLSTVYTCYYTTLYVLPTFLLSYLLGRSIYLSFMSQSESCNNNAAEDDMIDRYCTYKTYSTSPIFWKRRQLRYYTHTGGVCAIRTSCIQYILYGVYHSISTLPDRVGGFFTIGPLLLAEPPLS